MLLYNGLEIDFTIDPGDPGQTYGPPERCREPIPATIEVGSARVSDWDEFSDAYGYWNGRESIPYIRCDLDELIQTILEMEQDEIDRRAFKQAE